MRRLFFLLLLLTGLFLITGCDRFNHDFTPPDYAGIRNFYHAFSDSLQMISDTDVSAISGFYQDSYLQDGMHKSDMEQYFRNLFIDHPQAVIVADTTYLYEPNSHTFSWQFKATNTAGDSIFADTLFVDKIAAFAGSYQFTGNGQTASNNGSKQKVLAQMMTGTWCSNCVSVDHALRECELRFPNQFYYLEYHFNDALEYNRPLMTTWRNFYGGILNAPATFFQGQTLYQSSSFGLNAFTAQIRSLISQDAKLEFSNLTFTEVDSVVIGSVHIEPKAGLTQSYLKLNYALVEPISATLNFAQEPCRNVVHIWDSQDISGISLPATVNFSIPHPRHLPAQYKVIVWAQTMNTVWTNPQSTIYNVIDKKNY
jgi:hypothetical protein